MLRVEVEGFLGRTPLYLCANFERVLGLGVASLLPIGIAADIGLDIYVVVERPFLVIWLSSQKSLEGQA